MRKTFRKAEVYFSEHKAMAELATVMTGQLEKQALQAASSDLVLILPISRGSELELDHYPLKYPWFRDKAYVFLPEKYYPPKGLVKGVFGCLKGDHVVPYTDAELKRCDVATVMAAGVAHSTAIALLLESMK